MKLHPFTVRAIIVTSSVVGLIAYDGWRNRREVVRWLRFVNLWNAPVNPAADVAYRDVVHHAAD